MDHLPAGRSGASQHIPVPFVAGYDFDGQDFFSFPSRCGFDIERLQDESVASLSSLAQSWFYFGLLDVFFNRHVNPRTFRCDDSDEKTGDAPFTGARLVADGPLRALLDHWLAHVVIPVVNPPRTANLDEIDFPKLFDDKDETVKFLDDVLASLEVFEALPQASQAPLPVVLLSAKVLIGTLSGVLDEVITSGQDVLTTGYVDREWYSERHIPLRRSGVHDEDRPIPPTTQLLLDEFAAQRCCPLIARQLCETYNYVSTYYATRVGVTSNVSHDLCTVKECVANNIDEETYRTRHASPDCSCSHVSVPVEEVRAIIASGGIPLIRVEQSTTGGDGIIVKAKRMTSSTPYVAFSHVWSDGLGNRDANTLPACVLTKLQKHVEDLRQPKISFNTGIVNLGWLRWDVARMTSDISLGWFWLDTLCIPVERSHKVLKMKAINHMAAIYAGAAQVLVLDSGVEQFQPDRAATATSAAESCEILLRVCTTAWMRRCWTFQEAALGMKCQIQCRGEAIDPLDIPVGQLSDMQWAFFTADTPGQMLRRCATLIAKYCRTIRHLHMMGYMSTRSDGDSRAAIAAAVARPFHNVLVDHFQGRKTATARFDAARTDTVYREFVRCWNILNRRTATKMADTHLILASLLDFNTFEIIRLTDPAERMKCLLWSVPALPLELFFNSDGLRHEPGGHHRNRWLPLYLRRNSVRADPRVLVDGPCLELNGVPYPEEVKREAAPNESGTSLLEDSIQGPQHLCSIMLDQRAASGPMSLWCFASKADGSGAVCLELAFLREDGDTFADSFGPGNAVLVFDQDIANMSQRVVARGALFQVLDRPPEQPVGGKETPHSAQTHLDVVFDCPVTARKVQESPEDKTIHQAAGTFLDQPLTMKIQCDPPSTSYPLRKRTTRPQPAVLFGFHYTASIFLWLFLDLVATALLLSVCARHFAALGTFSKGMAIVRFVFDALTVMGLSKMQYFSVWLFMSWDILPLSIVAAYLASRLDGGPALFRTEYAFVVLSLASNTTQLVLKLVFKWLLLPAVIESWMLTFEPDWVPRGFRHVLLGWFDFRNTYKEPTRKRS